MDSVCRDGKRRHPRHPIKPRLVGSRGSHPLVPPERGRRNRDRVRGRLGSSSVANIPGVTGKPSLVPGKSRVPPLECMIHIFRWWTGHPASYDRFRDGGEAPSAPRANRSAIEHPNPFDSRTSVTSVTLSCPASIFCRCFRSRSQRSAERSRVQPLASRSERRRRPKDRASRAYRGVSFATLEGLSSVLDGGTDDDGRELWPS